MKDLRSVALSIQGGEIRLLDQTRLPLEEVWIPIPTIAAMVEAIQRLAVRGAPLISIAACLALARYAEQGASPDELRAAARALRESRPTAVNLMRALDRMLGDGADAALSAERLARTAVAIFEEDVRLCEKIAEHSAKLIPENAQILTHCNTGGLGTAGAGTAFAVIQRAHAQGKNIHVYVDETRPLLQGARLTTWELRRAGVPYTLICDNMAASLMRAGRIHCAIVGADRIALNGDFANKIGTYSVAALAAHHGLPFYCAAPRTTIDPEMHSGESIPIEERKAEEVRGFADALAWAPPDAPVYNPAFDVTPAALVSAWILDAGVFTPADIASGALKRVALNRD